jgi:hypothetical protein
VAEKIVMTAEKDLPCNFANHKAYINNTVFKNSLPDLKGKNKSPLKR